MSNTLNRGGTLLVACRTDKIKISQVVDDLDMVSGGHAEYNARLWKMIEQARG